MYGSNINVSIFKDGTKIDKNPAGVAELTDLHRFWADGCTFQVQIPCTVPMRLKSLHSGSPSATIFRFNVASVQHDGR